MSDPRQPSNEEKKRALLKKTKAESDLSVVKPRQTGTVKINTGVDDAARAQYEEQIVKYKDHLEKDLKRKKKDEPLVRKHNPIPEEWRQDKKNVDSTKDLLQKLTPAPKVGDVLSALTVADPLKGVAPAPELQRRAWKKKVEKIEEKGFDVTDTEIIKAEKSSKLKS